MKSRYAFTKTVVLIVAIIIVSLSILPLKLWKEAVTVSGAQTVAPLIPIKVKVISGDGIYDAYTVKKQIARYGREIQPASVRPYVVSLDVAGTTFQRQELLKKFVSNFSETAVSNMRAFGYKNITIFKIYSADFNEDYSACTISAALRVTDSTGSTIFIPYTALDDEAVTCPYGMGEETMDALDKKYSAALTESEPYNPFAGGNLSDGETAVISDLLYNNSILSTVPKDVAGIFSNYQENMSRDDFVYLLMSSLSKNYPSAFSMEKGTLYSQLCADAFTDTQMPYVNMASSMGLIAGRDGDGKFNPSASISRQEVAVILTKAIKKLEELGEYSINAGNPLAFNDVTPDVWSYDSVVFMSSISAPNGERLVSPEADGCFYPESSCSKAYALQKIWLLDSLLTPKKTVKSEQPVAFSIISSVNHSIISGDFLPPNAFTNNTDPTVKASFDSSVSFNTPGVHTVHINLKNENGKARMVQATLTVYDGVRSIVQEASANGEKISLNRFFAKSQDLSGAKLITNANYFLPSKPNSGYAMVQLGEDISYCAVSVVDTTPPSASPLTVETFAGESVSPEDFVTDVSDCSEVRFKFDRGTPNTSVAGESDVIILLTDDFGNSSLVASKLIVAEANFSPIAFEYIPNRYFQIGTAVDYLSQVALLKDCDPEAEITYDSSKVNASEPGRYPVVYTATDRKGNKTSVTAYVALTDTSIEKIFSLADRVLASITNANMSQREKAKAIYDWSRRNVSYVDTGDKIDPISGANNAFTKARGDCYTFYAVSEILLTRAGIKNICVERVGGRTRHYWHLVDVGDGWYHFDTTPYAIVLDGFMFTEEVAMERTASTRRNYNYNHSLYLDLDIK